MLPGHELQVGDRTQFNSVWVEGSEEKRFTENKRKGGEVMSVFSSRYESVLSGY